jgi:hypothetical protein
MRNVIAALILFFMGAFSGVIFAQARPDLAVPEVVAAFTECFDEVQKGCPLLLGYTQSLEVENAKLRRLAKTILFKSKTACAQGAEAKK